MLRSFLSPRRGLALAGLLALAAALPPAVGAQPAPPPPSPTGKSLAVLATDVYPRTDTEVDLGNSHRVRPLKTVKTTSGADAVADRLIVSFRDGTPDSDRADTHLKAAGRTPLAGRPVAELGPNTQLVDVSGAASLEAAIKAYRADPRVRNVAPDLLMHATETPNDTSFGQQWNMTKIQAPAAWNRTHGSSSVRVAILDTGINEAHPDLTSRVVARQDFTSSASGTTDVNGHGTHVAGIASAVTNNNLGVAGVGFDTRLLNVKVMDDTGAGPMSAAIQGIRWATQNGAHVINMSFASSSQDDCVPSFWENLTDSGVADLQDAIDEAWAANVVLVAAAGNNASSLQQWPASCSNVLSVASTDSSDALSGFSNFGTWVDLAAPGSGILSSAVPGAPSCAQSTTTFFAPFGQCSGTSMASPHVAGLAALVRASCGFTSASLIANRITSNADAIAGTGSNWQFGRINALRSVCFPAPTNLHIGTTTSSSIQILWNDNTPAESSFVVNYRLHSATVPNPNAWQSVAPLAPNSTSWTHPGPANAAGYDFRVEACDSNGCSSWSNSVTGFFGSAAFQLSVSRIGSGTVTSSPAGINCGGDCSETYPGSAVVTLFTLPASGYEFDHWTGACTGRNDTCTLTMSANRTTTAVFRFTGGA